MIDFMTMYTGTKGRKSKIFLSRIDSLFFTKELDRAYLHNAVHHYIKCKRQDLNKHRGAVVKG